MSSNSLIRLSDLPNRIPLNRNGKRRHVSSVYRYANRGVKGIKLQVWQLPDGLYTTLDAWDHFIERLTSLRLKSNPDAKSMPERQIEKRQRSVETAIEELRGSLRKKGAN